MRLKNLLFWNAAFVALVLDLLTKAWVVQNLELREVRPLLPGIFKLTYIINYGAAWGIMSNNGGWLRWLSLIASLLLVALAFSGSKLNRWEQLGWGCILGGAVGNGIERFSDDGGVTDFIQLAFINFPVFNIADSAITLGVCCLLWTYFRQSGSTQDSPPPDA